MSQKDIDSLFVHNYELRLRVLELDASVAVLERLLREFLPEIFYAYDKTLCPTDGTPDTVEEEVEGAVILPLNR